MFLGYSTTTCTEDCCIPTTPTTTWRPRGRTWSTTMSLTIFVFTGTCRRFSVTNTGTTSPKSPNGASNRTSMTTSGATKSVYFTTPVCFRPCCKAEVPDKTTWSETAACPTRATSPSIWKYSQRTWSTSWYRILDSRVNT